MEKEKKNFVAAVLSRTREKKEKRFIKKQFAEEREKLKEQLHIMSRKMEETEKQFIFETDPELIETIVWERKSLEIQYRRIIKNAKKLYLDYSEKDRNDYSIDYARIASSGN